MFKTYFDSNPTGVCQSRHGALCSSISSLHCTRSKCSSIRCIVLNVSKIIQGKQSRLCGACASQPKASDEIDGAHPNPPHLHAGGLHHISWQFHIVLIHKFTPYPFKFHIVSFHNFKHFSHQRMELLLEKTPPEDVRSDVLPMVYRALESGVSQIQELCLSIIPSFAGNLKFLPWVISAIFLLLSYSSWLLAKDC